jgi:hypothetical protein
VEVNGVKLAADAAGSQRNLAKALGVTEQAVHNWVAKGWVPLRRSQEIEALYGVPRGLTINPRIKDLVSEFSNI